jgi:hypothetical protein
MASNEPINPFLNPYTVKGRIFSVVRFEGTTLFAYGPFGLTAAIKKAREMNIAYQIGLLRGVKEAENLPAYKELLEAVFKARKQKLIER